MECHAVYEMTIAKQEPNEMPAFTVDLIALPP